MQFYKILKRLLDIFVALAGIMVLAPVFIIIAILILLDSPGPIIYRGKRTGLDSKPFEIYKFRTMVVNTEKPAGDTTALNDARITQVGRFLRRYKIDELPQLVNVLKGEMSIVGPRPELIVYTERYTKDEGIILSVRPGITDYSSIELRYLDEMVGERDADMVFEKKILPRKNELRIWYVKTQSFGGDLDIIFKTVTAIFSKPSKRKS